MAEAVRADERRSDFKPRNLGQIRQLIKKNWAWTGTYFADVEDQRRVMAQFRTIDLLPPARWIFMLDG